MAHRSINITSMFLSMTVLALVTGCPVPPPAPATEFRAQLSGANEVPPVTTAATGAFEAEIVNNDQAIEFRLEAQNIVNVTAAHIHVGGATVNGPVILFLFDATTDGPFTSPVTGTLTAADLIPAGGVNTFAEAIANIRAGNTYVNVHTTANPAGEIRGQLIAVD
jgi:hypothetical protein